MTLQTLELALFKQGEVALTSAKQYHYRYNIRVFYMSNGLTRTLGNIKLLRSRPQLIKMTSWTTSRGDVIIIFIVFLNIVRFMLSFTTVVKSSVRSRKILHHIKISISMPFEPSLRYQVGPRIPCQGYAMVKEFVVYFDWDVLLLEFWFNAVCDRTRVLYLHYLCRK